MLPENEGGPDGFTACQMAMPPAITVTKPTTNAANFFMADPLVRLGSNHAQAAYRHRLGTARSHRQSSPRAYRAWPSGLALADTVQVLRDHRKRQTEERLRVGPEWRGTDDYVFSTAWGEPVHTDTVSSLMITLINTHND